MANILAFFLISISTLNHVNYVLSLKTENIVGGVLSCPGEFGYACLLQVGDDYSCGCGILDDYHVITAGHCFYNEDGTFRDLFYNVLAGVNDVRQPDTGIASPVKKAYFYKDYLPRKILHDFAILELSESLDIKSNKFLEALEVPKGNGVYDKYINKEAVIAGYGLDSIKAKKNDKTGEVEVLEKHRGPLRNFLKVNIISNKECGIDIVNTVMCAKSKTKSSGTCSGDSGSPLVVDGNLGLGILTTSPYDCDDAKLASKYIKLGPYYQIIDDIKNGRPNENVTMKPITVKSLFRTLLEEFLRKFFSTPTVTNTNNCI